MSSFKFVWRRPAFNAPSQAIPFLSREPEPLFHSDTISQCKRCQYNVREAQRLDALERHVTGRIR